MDRDGDEQCKIQNAKGKSLKAAADSQRARETQFLLFAFAFRLLKSQRKVSPPCLGPARADTGAGLSE